MKTLFTAEVVSKAGRSGTLKSPEGLLDITLGNPLEKGVESHGLNPELMFAGAYAACYNGALANAAETLGTSVKDSTARVLVHLVEDDQGGYGLSVELHAELPLGKHALVRSRANRARATKRSVSFGTGHDERSRGTTYCSVGTRPPRAHQVFEVRSRNVLEARRPSVVTRHRVLVS